VLKNYILILTKNSDIIVLSKFGKFIGEVEEKDNMKRI